MEEADWFEATGWMAPAVGADISPVEWDLWCSECECGWSRFDIPDDLGESTAESLGVEEGEVCPMSFSLILCAVLGMMVSMKVRIQDHKAAKKRSSDKGQDFISCK